MNWVLQNSISKNFILAKAINLFKNQNCILDPDDFKYDSDLDFINNNTMRFIKDENMSFHKFKILLTKIYYLEDENIFDDLRNLITSDNIKVIDLLQNILENEGLQKSFDEKRKISLLLNIINHGYIPLLVLSGNRVIWGNTNSYKLLPKNIKVNSYDF